MQLKCENCGNTVEQEPGETVKACPNCGSWTDWTPTRGDIPNMDVDTNWVIEEMEELLTEAEHRDISQEKFLRIIINWWLGYVDTRLAMMEDFMKRVEERKEASDG